MLKKGENTRFLTSDATDLLLESDMKEILKYNAKVA